jgi:hypothetical protein
MGNFKKTLRKKFPKSCGNKKKKKKKEEEKKRKEGVINIQLYS